MRRRRRAVDIRLGSIGLDAARARLDYGDDGTTPGHPTWIRATRNGDVHARLHRGSRHTCPGFRGRLETDGRDVRLVGMLREAHSEVVTPRMFTVLGLFMAAVAIALTAGGEPVPGALICGPAGLLFLFLGFALGAGRRTSFRVDVAEFTAKVERYWGVERHHRFR